jgi:hypothetical protein
MVRGYIVGEANWGGLLELFLCSSKIFYDKMKLLDEIQNELTDSEKSLTDILRKSKIVGSLLKNQQLKEWVDRELKGYWGVEKKDIPDYRITKAQNFGNFSGPFGSGVNNGGIPTAFLPEDIKELFSDLVFRQSISELQSMANSGSKSMMNKWPTEIIAHMQRKVTIYEGMHIVEAWQHISIEQIIGVLDTVRNRLLDFILELKEAYPDQTQEESKLSEIPKEEVTNHFHTYISGGKNIIASGSNVKQHIDKVVLENDIESLKSFLENLSLPSNEITELENIVTKDEAIISNKKLGPKVSKWLGKVTEKAVSGSIEIASKEGITVIINAIKEYYGLST